MADAIPIPSHPRFQDLTGMVFGRLTVLAYSGKRGRWSFWLCRCECGTTKTINGNGIKQGVVLSCGCLHREISARVIAKIRTTHGKTETVEYRIWSNMKDRCKAKYSRRGVKVCDRWQKSFLAFLSDMGSRPSIKHSIDRIDNDAHYSCGKCSCCTANGWIANCRWTTNDVQQRNKSNTKFLTRNGERRPLTEWAEILGVHPNKLWSKVARGLSDYDVLE